MSRSPEEIRGATFDVVVRGFDRAAVRQVLEEAAAYEAAILECDRLQERVVELEAELARFRELERLLRDTLVVAQRSGEEIRAQAKQDADALLSDARTQAAGIVDEAEAAIEAQRRRLEQLRQDEADLRTRVSDLLRSALARWDDESWPEFGAQPGLGLPALAVDAGSSLLGSKGGRGWAEGGESQLDAEVGATTETENENSSAAGD